MRWWWAFAACAVVGGCSGSKKVEFTARELNPDLKDVPLVESVIDENELGLPIYPGAKTPKGLPAMARSSTPDVESGLQLATVEVWLETKDSPAEVAAFYRPRIGKAEVTTTKTGIALEGLNLKSEKCRILANRSETSKLTSISLISIKNVAGAKLSPEPPSGSSSR